MLRLARWGAFVILTILSYAVLAGVCQALTSLAFRLMHHEFDQSLPHLALILVLSLAIFVVAGRLVAWTLPVEGRAVFQTLVLLACICAFVPVEELAVSLVWNAAIRLVLAALACGLMLAGARLPFSHRGRVW